MGKKRKKPSRQENKHPADKRPGQLTALLVLWCVSIFALLYVWYSYLGVVGGNSLPVPAEFLPAYRVVLLLTALFDLLILILLFLGVKAGFWVAVVLISLDLLGRILRLNLLSIFVDALSLYCLLCQPTRVYFRVGQFKAFGPRKK